MLPRASPFRPREAVYVVLVALALRVAAAVALDTPGNAELGLWEWGYEAGCIGDSIARGEGFANTWTRDVAPWSAGSGATAWLTPAYPALLALCFELGGGLTRASAWMVIVLQSAASALTCVLLAHLGARLAAARAGRIAAWALALHPLAIWHSVATVWDTTFAALAFTGVLAALAACQDGSLRRGWSLLGLVHGAALLVNAAALALVPVVLWQIWRKRPKGSGFLGAAGPYAIATFAVVLPWMARNANEVGVFTLRPNLGVEMRVGNTDASVGHYRPDLHPSHSPEEFARFREMGEARYTEWARDEAFAWVAAHPLDFARLTVLRGLVWWFGVPPWADDRVDRGRSASDDPKSWAKWSLHLAVGMLGLAGGAAWALARREAWPFLATLVLVPPVYCAAHMMERYRFPIEPLLVLCAAWLADVIWTPRSERTRSGTAR